MSKIVSIGKAVPAFRHEQDDILEFMQQIYAITETDKRKLRMLYRHSGIDCRYSVLSDYSRPMTEWKFYPHSESLEPFPSLEQRMFLYNKFAPSLSVDAIRNCLGGRVNPTEISHLITVSCTGMSAPGLDLQVMELMDLPKNIFRTSINFMGCYAGIQGLKMANLICQSDPHAKVIVVCTELCTLHFQKEPTPDNFTSSLIFGDGSAAALVVGDDHPSPGFQLADFYSEVIPKGKKDMAWELSSTGFLMTLSSYVPDLIESDFEMLVTRALNKQHLNLSDISHWCIHPGGRKILESVYKALHFSNGHLKESYSVLKDFGNMSSPTILFVLEEIMKHIDWNEPNRVFAAAFGPGLTMETFIASTSLQS